MNYRIVCTDQIPINQPNNHAHIVSVGVDTNNDDRADKKFSKEQVISDIDNNLNQYCTIGEVSGKKVFVEVVNCAFCGYRIIKTFPDNVKDNNLDSLRRCNWKS